MSKKFLSLVLCLSVLLAACGAPAAPVPPAEPTQVAVAEPTAIPQPTAVDVPATATAEVVEPTAPPPTDVPTAVVEPTATAGAADCPPPPPQGAGKQPPPPPGKKPPAGCPPPPGGAAASAGTSATSSGSGTSSGGAAATTTTTSTGAATTTTTTTTTSTGGAAAKSYGTVSGDWRYISGTGIPSHSYADPNKQVVGQSFTFSLPANPVKGSGAISLPTRNPNLIATSIYGIPIFSDVNAEGTDIYTAGEKFDKCYGHPNFDGWYHYHVFGSCVTSDSTALWAYALDGFPIYGPYDSGSSSEPADLDGCRGHEHGNLGYHYHTKDPSRTDSKYIIACFMGSTLGSWVNGSSSGP